MDDGSVSEVLQLLHNILGEVRAVKKTVDTHEAKFDDIMLQLRLQQSPDEAAPLKTLPRITCDVEMMAGGSSDEDVTNQRAQGTELGPSTDSILWNRNPLADSTNSLDLGTSDSPTPVGPMCEGVAATLPTPTSCEPMITISSVVNHSLASIPLHRLADKPQSALNSRSSGLTQAPIGSRSAPVSPARRSDLQDTPKSSFGKRMTTPTDFNCNDNSSTESDIDRSAPADPLTTHSASSLSTSYSLDPLRPSPPLFHPFSSSADAATNPTTSHRPLAGSVQPISLPLKRPGTFGKQANVLVPSGDLLKDGSSNQVPSSALQSALDDNDKDLVNLTTTGITQCGPNPTISMTNKSGPSLMNASACDPTMCSMNGGLTFRHMLHEPSLPSPSARYSDCSTSSDTADAVPAGRASTTSCSTVGKASQARILSRSLSPGEPMLTFRVMLPATPEEQRGKGPRDTDHDIRSSSAPTEFSPPPSSLGSDLTDPNSASPERQSTHLHSCHNEIDYSSSGSKQELLHSVESPWKGNGSPSSLLQRPMLRSCHGQLDSSSRYTGGCASQSDTRSPFSRSTSAASTPKRKFGEMRQADSPAAFQRSVPGAAVGAAEHHLVPHVPRLQLPHPGVQTMPTNRYLSPPLHVTHAITDFALLDEYDGDDASPRALGRYGSRYQPSNSVDSDDILPFCGNLGGQELAKPSWPVAGEVMALQEPDDENRPPVEREHCATSQCSPYECTGIVSDSTPAAVQESSESTYESPPSLVPPPAIKAQHTAGMGSAAGSECTVEMGSCSPMQTCAPLASCTVPCGGDVDEDVPGSPCMRASIAFAPEQMMQTLPQFHVSTNEPQHKLQSTRVRAVPGSVQSSGGSAASVDGDSDCRPGNSCMESRRSHENYDSPQASGSTVYSSYYSRSEENACPNAFPCIPDTPSSKGASDVEQPCGIDADTSVSQPPALGMQRCQQGMHPRIQVSGQPVSGGRDTCHMSGCSPDMQQPRCIVPLQEDDSSSSGMLSRQAAESLTSDEINAWKAQHCIPSLTQENEDDSLVILTNKLLRTAFRAQRRADMQKSLTSGGSYAAPRRFLCTPLDPSVLDALAVPVAVRASETSETVENIVDATLPNTLRLSHCFAAWRYIMGGGRGAHSAACSQSVETLSGDAKTACSTQLSGSETLASDVCTEDAVSYIRKIVVHSCLFSLELSGQADVRASTVSNARSGPGLWLI